MNTDKMEIVVSGKDSRDVYQVMIVAIENIKLNLQKHGTDNELRDREWGDEIRRFMTACKITLKASQAMLVAHVSTQDLHSPRALHVITIQMVVAHLLPMYCYYKWTTDARTRAQVKHISQVSVVRIEMCAGFRNFHRSYIFGPVQDVRARIQYII